MIGMPQRQCHGRLSVQVCLTGDPQRLMWVNCHCSPLEPYRNTGPWLPVHSLGHSQEYLTHSWYVTPSNIYEDQIRVKTVHQLLSRKSASLLKHTTCLRRIWNKWSWMNPKGRLPGSMWNMQSCSFWEVRGSAQKYWPLTAIAVPWTFTEIPDPDCHYSPLDLHRNTGPWLPVQSPGPSQKYWTLTATAVPWTFTEILDPDLHRNAGPWPSQKYWTLTFTEILDPDLHRNTGPWLPLQSPGPSQKHWTLTATAVSWVLTGILAWPSQLYEGIKISRISESVLPP